MPGWESVIGLEVHAQLKTRTKIFCGCPTEFGAPPNTQTCPVCLGHPGTLPVLNRRVVELAVTGALALGCEVQSHSIFARKNYFYPDLPKGYQISQYEEPLATGGAVEIEVCGQPRRIALIRLHLEEDAGKSIHDGMPESDRYSYIDLNRSGVPLVEIVTQPVIRTPEEAYLFLQRLRSILRYIDVCDGNMEQGSLRCDANVSIRPEGQDRLGTRTEVKNINSFRNVQRALDYEIERHKGIVDAGESVEQETVLWDAAAGVTRPMRGKEEAHDYRYLPEPDLPPLVVDEALVGRLRDGLPELPAERRRRLAQSYGLSEYESQLLTLEAPLAEYYEEVAGACGNHKAAANFILNDLLRAQNQDNRDADEIPLPAAHLGQLIRLVDEGIISVSVARRELFPEMDALRVMIREVLEANPAQLERYRAGKTGLLGFFVGQVMRRSGGKADPKKVSALLEEENG